VFYINCVLIFSYQVLIDLQKGMERVGNTTKENSTVFSLILLYWLLSAWAYG